MPRLLLIDNAAPVRAMLRAAAERAGWSVVEAADARAAVRSFAELRPDAVLLDLILPGTEELFVLRAIRKLDPAAKVILATAWPGRQILADAQRLGVQAIHLKPFDPAALFAALGPPPAPPTRILPLVYDPAAAYSLDAYAS